MKNNQKNRENENVISNNVMEGIKYFKYYDLKGNQIALKFSKKENNREIFIIETNFGDEKPIPLIYNVQEVIEAIQKENIIYMTYNEITAEELRKKGLVATTLLGGINNVKVLPRKIKNILEKAKIAFVMEKDMAEKLGNIIYSEFYSNEYIGGIYNCSLNKKENKNEKKE